MARRYCPAEASMNSDMLGWAESARHWRARSKSARASNHGRSCSATFSEAERPAHTTAYWPRVMGWAPSTWCIAANSDAWRLYGETGSFPSRCWRPLLRIVRGTRKSLTPRPVFLTSSTARVRKLPDRFAVEDAVYRVFGDRMRRDKSPSPQNRSAPTKEY